MNDNRTVSALMYTDQKSSLNAAGFFSQNMKTYLLRVMELTRSKQFTVRNFLSVMNQKQSVDGSGPSTNLTVYTFCVTRNMAMQVQNSEDVSLLIKVLRLSEPYFSNQIFP